MNGDAVRAEVFVRVPQAEAFELFTTRLDTWWQSGARFRNAGPRASLMHLECALGGRLFESLDDGAVVEVGRVTTWEPPRHIAFVWRNANFTQGEQTEVLVHFEPREGGTHVRVEHRGWSALRPDHPARHGLGVAAFQRMLGSWWGDQLSSLRLLAHGLR